jgi:hypothetical protein
MRQDDPEAHRSALRYPDTAVDHRCCSSNSGKRRALPPAECTDSASDAAVFRPVADKAGTVALADSDTVVPADSGTAAVVHDFDIAASSLSGFGTAAAAIVDV